MQPKTFHLDHLYIVNLFVVLIYRKVLLSTSQFTGDFAIYIKEGLPRWKALLLNFLAALIAFGGMFIGLLLGEYEEARRWLLAVVAGCFIYISLVAVVSNNSICSK